MSDYLLEIGTEELPAGHIPEAQRKLEELLVRELDGKQLGNKSVKTLATPRRLAVIISGLPE